MIEIVVIAVLAILTLTFAARDLHRTHVHAKEASERGQQQHELELARLQTDAEARKLQHTLEGRRVAIEERQQDIEDERFELAKQEDKVRQEAEAKWREKYPEAGASGDFFDEADHPGLGLGGRNDAFEI